MDQYSRGALRVCAIVALVSSVSCKQDDPPPGATTQLSRDNTFVGCVAQTGQPDLFLLSIVAPRNTQADRPAGTAIPAPTQSPSEPTPRETDLNPVSTIGPGAGPTTTTEIETYRLIGTGGLDLRSQVGRMVEVIGDVERPPADRPSGANTSPIGELRVRSARQLAEGCPRQMDAGTTVVP